MSQRMIDGLPELDRGAMLAAMTGAAGVAARSGHVALATSAGRGVLDPAAEARKIAFDRIGHGEKVLLISGFPQTRRSWNRVIPLLSRKFEAIPADLPSFGDSGFLEAPATTENVGKVFHAFVGDLGAPLHVVAHDFGAWCAYSWALQFPQDFKSLTLIDAGIPGVTPHERRAAVHSEKVRLAADVENELSNDWCARFEFAVHRVPDFDGRRRLLAGERIGNSIEG
jgi:pimeloyl-ACP methyl ester carboxylesterase